MRKIQKVMMGLFLTGVLCGGIGTGVALVEYMSLGYGGTKIIGEENLVTKHVDFTIEPGEKQVILFSGYWTDEADEMTFEEDDTIPVGTVRYEVTYNEERIKPTLKYEEYMDSEEYAGALRLYGNYRGDDFALLMENKDQILKELKENKVSSYEVAGITAVKVLVNPETMPYLENKIE